MFPEFLLFGTTFSTYGLLTAIGMIAMTLTLLWLGKSTKLSYFDLILGELIALTGGFIGSHLLYAFVNFQNFLPYYKFYFTISFNSKDFFNVLYNNFYGMVFYGGLIFGLIFGFIFAKIRKLNIDEFSDCFGVAVPLFHCFGRIGCFLSGCCYGIESRFGFTATDSALESCNNVCRFPVQLLEAFCELLIFFLLLILFRKKYHKGKILIIYLFLYSIIRFSLEFLRGDVTRGIYLGLSTGQWISIVLFIFSCVILCKKRKTKHKITNV